MEIVPLTQQDLSSFLLSDEASEFLCSITNQQIQNTNDKEKAWQYLSKHVLTGKYPFAVHLFIFNYLFTNWHLAPESAPAWLPEPQLTANANITKWLTTKNFNSVQELQKWSHTSFMDFWKEIIEQLHIVFKKPYTLLCDLSRGIETPNWLVNAKMNIVDSCFLAEGDATAIIYSDKNNQLHRLSYQELDTFSSNIAYSLERLGYQSGDTMAIAMPMNHYAVAIYLGIIKMGGVVVSIADSFSSQEMATRLKITETKLVFTQDFIPWENKAIPLYEKVCQAHCGQIILAPSEHEISLEMNAVSIAWEQFFKETIDYQSVARDPMSACNILFSSGTTGEPKAIVWNHTTPLKAGSDAYFHQDIHADDVLAWPTNLGWMMGPWLVFAALINRATIALYHEAPKGRGYGEFIQNAQVTMLGVVPTLVASWRQSKCMEGSNWTNIKLYASTGECSNSEDMLYLMSLAGYKPIMEYCGGTEIGGAYLSSTIVQKNYPSLFSTPTFGLDIELLDEEGAPATLGEVAIVGPSIGLSTQLLNANHHDIYFKNMPNAAKGTKLRRHGDLLQCLPNHYYCILGRVDDTMNLSGIKVSAAEIERVLVGLPDIIEVAAIAISPANNGPNELVIYASRQSAQIDEAFIQKEFQQRINKHLNPFFKIHKVVFVNELPKTASNKIMRRVLRNQYLAGSF